MTTIQTGLESFVRNPPSWAAGCRVGLLCNPASVDKHFRHARVLIDKACHGKLAALFSPQHGFFSEKQDNMVESEHMVDPGLNIPVFSLYGRTRIPTAEMFDLIDVLIIDLQDAGTRVYTFVYTMSYCMEAAKKFDKTVVILDRPNPLNGTSIEGNCLSEEHISFVGRFPIPMRHGMTIGELALLFNRHFGIGCRLEVVPMKGWTRNMYFTDTGLPWIPPSPNLPTPAAAMVYPGQVVWEGTNVSEGRGTTQPFEIFGAPFVDPGRLLEKAGPPESTGVVFRPLAFEPTSNKWKGQLCHGFQLHVVDPAKYAPYRTSLTLLQAVLAHHRKDFQWKDPPYEYEFEKRPIDLILGSRSIRRRIEALEEIEQIEADWQAELNEFKALSREYYIY